MNRITSFFTAATLAFVLIGCSSEGADLVLHNGTIWTADPSNPWAEAVSVTGDVFTLVGTSEEALASRGTNTNVVDLQGQLVIPGFNDTHIHFGSAARFLEFNIMRTASQEDFVERTRDVTSRLAEGEWILGGMWGAYDDWAEGSVGDEARAPFVPDIARIETLTANYPMFIRKFDRSEFAANEAAFLLAGVDPEAPSAEGVTFDTDDEGRATGIFRGGGVGRLFQEVIPSGFSLDRRFAQTRNALAAIRRVGVTSVSDMSDDTQLEIYRALRESGELTTRIHYRYFLDRWSELKNEGTEVGTGDEWIRLGALKGHIDGIMGTSSARFFQPYETDPNNYGRWRQLMVGEEGEFVEGQFLGYMLNADSANLQLSIHAIGDEANSLLMDYLERLDGLNGEKERRFRLVHAQVIAPEDFARLGRLGVIAEVQPFHLSDDMRWMEERIGRERSKGAYAFKTLLDGGAVLAFGSDWPGTSAAEYPINPMLGLYAAITRQTISGDPEGGWFADERISLEEALRAYTYNGAYSTFEEALKGSISVGKLADLAVLDNNLFEIAPEDILSTEVIMTIVGGRVVYEK